VCLNPSKIADLGFVACRNCWQCRETKVDDWVGRNIAESKTARAAHVVTLTYGKELTTGDVDHIRAAVLTYSDVQKFLKLLRHEYPVRYFVVGEYGTIKGRAHWHIIMYWQDKVPEHKLRKNFMFEHWPHGWSYWDKCSPEAIRYACKYLLKDPADEEKESWGPMPSKKPPLGHDYFKTLALRYVDMGLTPQDLFYSWPEVKRVNKAVRARTRSQFEEKARPIKFRMHGKTADNFLSYFYEQYVNRYDDEPPRSELLWEHLNKKLRAFLDGEDIEPLPGVAGQSESDRAKALAAYLGEKATTRFQVRHRGVKPLRPPPGGRTIQFCELANCFYCDDAGASRLYYSSNSEGDAVWHEKIRPRVEIIDLSEVPFIKNEYQAVPGYKPFHGEKLRYFGEAE
jgi:hypothetical protein